MMSKKWIILIVCLAAIVALEVCLIISKEMKKGNEDSTTEISVLAPEESETLLGAGEDTEDTEDTAMQETENQSLPVLPVPVLTFSSSDTSQISVSWPDTNDEITKAYLISRKLDSDTEWTSLSTIESDLAASGESYTYTDYLSDPTPTQYIYRIEAQPLDESQYKSSQSNEVLGCNVCICLDPGHFQKASSGRGTDMYGYDEGTFTLSLGLNLRDTLRNQYGIDARMTRDTDHITINGHRDQDLDSNYLALRGQYAEGCNLFISLHTNANLDNANGYGTWNQPINIIKPIIILNQQASFSPTLIAQANAIGRNLAATSYGLGIASVQQFLPGSIGAFPEWSDATNDALDTPGTIYVRWKDTGEDYYGVLRGAASVGVPGMIIEHGHHTVAEMRKLAQTGELAKKWAEADAAGIAEGYGFRGQANG